MICFIKEVDFQLLHADGEYLKSEIFLSSSWQSEYLAALSAKEAMNNCITHLARLYLQTLHLELGSSIPCQEFNRLRTRQ